MGLGVPVISANCPRVLDLIQDRVNGRLVPVDDVDALAQAMAELIERPDERARLGLAAREVRERFRQDRSWRCGTVHRWTWACAE